MPLPIRPAGETQDGSLGKTYGDPFAFVPISSLQKQIMEQEAAPYNEKLPQKEAKSYKSVGDSSRKQLFNIWDNREPEIIQAQTSLNMEPSFKIPKSMTSSEIMRLVSEGLLSRQEGNRISFTRLGKQALNKEVMSQPNAFMSKRTREKALKIAQNQSLGDSTNQVTTSLNTTNAQMDSLKQLLMQDQAAYEEFMQKVPEALKNLNTKIKDMPLPSMKAANTNPKKEIESAIFNKIASCDIIQDSNKIQKLNNILKKLDLGYLTQDEANLILE